MSPRRSGRTQQCGVTEARAKLQRAERFLEAAQFISDEPDPDADFVSAAAALTVLAGISASDAACCRAPLSSRVRGEAHPHPPYAPIASPYAASRFSRPISGVKRSCQVR